LVAVKGLGRKGATVDLELECFRKYLDQFASILPLNGIVVSGTILNGATTATIRHSLGRAYQGGFVIGVSRSESVTVRTRLGASATVDPSTTLIIQSRNAVTADTVVDVWVF
jgi:hypothetical protein